MNFEVVIETLEELKVTNNYQIKRVELCSALDLGGLTPNLGLIEEVVDQSKAEVHLMIRPRAGDFVYNSDEVQVMKKDIISARNLNCKGVVFGLLNKENELDIKKINPLVQFSKDLGLEITFHRAIDFSKNINKSIEILIECGIDRILTSGGKADVDKGINEIKKIFTTYGEIIKIMPGGGINFQNAKSLIDFGITDIHFNIRKITNQSNLMMGLKHPIDEEKIENITSIRKVAIQKDNLYKKE